MELTVGSTLRKVSAEPMEEAKVKLTLADKMKQQKN